MENNSDNEKSPDIKHINTNHDDNNTNNSMHNPIKDDMTPTTTPTNRRHQHRHRHHHNSSSVNNDIEPEIVMAFQSGNFESNEMKQLISLTLPEDQIPAGKAN